MPNVYKTSYVVPELVAKFPEVVEQDFQAPIEPEPELGGEVRVDRQMFGAWLELSDAGQTPATPPQYPCADAVMYYARNQQGPDMRGGVTADTAWELCCRTLSELVDIYSLSSRTLAQLLMYWLDGDETSPGSQLPVAMREIIYRGMLADLTERGKEIRSEADEAVMKMRWVKQLLHGEFDSARETWLTGRTEAPAVDLDVQGDIPEPEGNAAIKEDEEAAAERIEECVKDESERLKKTDRGLSRQRRPLRRQGGRSVTHELATATRRRPSLRVQW